MDRIFLGLVIWNIALFGATIYTASIGRVDLHFGIGAFTGIFNCFVHSLVFIQLIGSGKGVKEAIEAYSLPDDPETGFTKRAKQLKGRAFPHAMIVPMVTIATTWLGAWHHTNAAAAPGW
jgi:hypothetical protein